MPVNRFALRPGSAFARLGPRLIEEKLKSTRLARALDDAGVRLDDGSVRKEARRLRDHDLHLTIAILGLEDDPDNEAYRAAAVRALKESEVRRGALVDAVPAFLRDEVARSLDRVAASEPEIWMELDATRPLWEAEFRDHRVGKSTPSWKSSRGAPRRTLSDPAPPRERLDVERRRPASREEELSGLKRTRAQERRALPSGRAPLARWFSRMPSGWREAVARMHDLDLDPSAASDRRAVAERLAQRIVDAAWLRRYLVERLGAGERELLALILFGNGLPLLPGEALTASFDMRWDWRFTPAPNEGGRLRIAGLVHVGHAKGLTYAVVPPPLKGALLDALRHVDPEAASAPDREYRLDQAARPEFASDANPLLVRWKTADSRFTKRMNAWLLRSFEEDLPCADAWAAFARAARTTRSPSARRGGIDHAVLDWRETPDQPTLAEWSLPRSRFRSPREGTVARALVAAPPALFRIAGIDDDGRPILDPLFPAGRKVVLNDPTLALADDVGRLIAGRAYSVGPFTFFRALSHSVPGDREPRLLKALARELRAFVRNGGPDDAATLVRARPGLFLRALRSCGR